MQWTNNGGPPPLPRQPSIRNITVNLILYGHIA